MIASPRTLLLSAAGAAVLAAAGAAPPRGASASPRPRAAPAAAPALLGGVNVAGLGREPFPDGIDHAVAVAARLHSRLVRYGVAWSALEPSTPRRLDADQLAILDRLVADAAAARIGVVLAVDSTPCWDSSAPAALLRACAPHRSSRASSWPPRHPASYAAFVALLARRYGRRLAAIEVWNEPDQSNELYFAGPHKAERYAALLRAAYVAIKQVQPHTRVLGGSLVGTNGAFLRALYAAGIKGYYDALAVHFYTLTIAALRTTREAQLANGDAAPLWLDEFGWPSCWPRRRIEQEQPCVKADTQADNITNTFRQLARLPYVAAAALYKMQDSREEDFGLLDAEGARKPSYAALARVLSSPGGPIAGVTLSLRSSSGRVVVSGSAPVGDFMRLEAFSAGALRYRALFTLDRFNRYSLVLPGLLGSRGLTIRVSQSGGAAAPAQSSD